MHDLAKAVYTLLARLGRVTGVIELPDALTAIVKFSSSQSENALKQGISVKAKKYDSAKVSILTGYVVPIIHGAFLIARAVNRMRAEHNLKQIDFYEEAIRYDHREKE